MNILKKLIVFIVFAFLAYNATVIISFNRYVSEYINPESKNPPTTEELVKRYESLNPVQQYLSRYSSIENGIIDRVKNTHTNTSGDAKVSVFTQNGSYVGTYMGELTDTDVPNGAGKVVFTNKDGVNCTYEGEFSDGVLSGYGTLSFATGQIIKGSFRDGMLNGYGEMYDENGKISSRGSYINNKLNGNGILFDKNGKTIFSGTFEYGLPSMADYKALCESVEYDVLKNNPTSLVGKNICLTGELSDVHIDKNSKQFHLFTPTKDPTASFLVYCEDPEISFNLSNEYTIYGYCLDYGAITNSHSVTTNGLKLSGYHFENN